MEKINSGTWSNRDKVKKTETFCNGHDKISNAPVMQRLRYGHGTSKNRQIIVLK